MSFRKQILLSQCLLLLGLITVLMPLLGTINRFVLRKMDGEAVAKMYEAAVVKRALDWTTLIVSVAVLAINGILIMFIVHRVMHPVQQIIEAIYPYKEGFMPRIILKGSVIAKEFTKLASTINSLTDQIRKQIDFLTKQREETEEILESIGEGIIAADPSAKVIFANRAACRMLGVTPEQILKKTLDSLKGVSQEAVAKLLCPEKSMILSHVTSGSKAAAIHSTRQAPSGPAEENGRNVAQKGDFNGQMSFATASQDILKKSHEMIVYALQTAEPMQYTWIVRGKGTFYHDLIAAPLEHKDGALLVLQDKTSDYRIVELGKDFIANASHELKTPITIIRGFAETLQDLPKLSREMLSQITEKIVKTCIRLDKLVKSLLTLTDIEHLSDEQFVKTDLILLIENCMEMILAAHPEVKVQLHAQNSSALIWADADLFELAVMNLLENAVKYSKNAPSIDIFVEEKKGEIALRFADQGIGIPEEDLSQIFERFYTVDKARSRKKGGAGLGLSIVKTIVEKHFGKITVSSLLGKGSIFTLILPKKRT